MTDKKEVKAETSLEKARRVKAENLVKKKEDEKKEDKPKFPKTSPQGMAKWLKKLSIEAETLSAVLKEVKTYKFDFDEDITIAITKVNTAQTLLKRCLDSIPDNE